MLVEKNIDSIRITFNVKATVSNSKLDNILSFASQVDDHLLSLVFCVDIAFLDKVPHHIFPFIKGN